MFFAQPSQLSHFGPFLDFFCCIFSKCLSPLYCPSPLFLSVTRRDRIEHSEEENEHILYIMNASEEEENDWLVSAQMQMIIRHSTNKRNLRTG